MTDSPPRSLLPHYLAALYGLAIVYSSLQPFGPWMAPPPGTPFYLFAPWPPRYPRLDVQMNIVAYVPFGLFLALAGSQRLSRHRFATAVLGGALLSLIMESLQAYIPTRYAGNLDVLCNTAGAAIGGWLGCVTVRTRVPGAWLDSARQRLFIAGKVGDLGIALLATWLVVQVNPGIPLFAIMYEPSPAFVVVGSDDGAVARDVAGVLVEGAHSGFQLLGVGLFLALLLRERHYTGGAVLVLIGSAVLVKGIAAQLLLRPAAFERWLTPGVSTGVAAGALFLLVAITLPRAVQVALATVALLSSLLATLFAPGLIVASAPLAIFNWRYGHLLNFNGLTHAVLIAWPLAASALLFALAGRPHWGDPGPRNWRRKDDL